MYFYKIECNSTPYCTHQVAKLLPYYSRITVQQTPAMNAAWLTNRVVFTSMQSDQLQRNCVSSVSAS